MAQTAWQIWRKKIFIFLPSKKTPYTVSFLQNWKNKYYSTKQKIFLNILCLPCRFEETNIFIILPSLKENSLNMLSILCRFEEIKCIFISPSKKTSLNIQGLLCGFEEINTFIILPSIKNIPWISWVFFENLKQ